jgi:hypothetical protein
MTTVAPRLLANYRVLFATILVTVIVLVAISRADDPRTPKKQDAATDGFQSPPALLPFPQDLPSLRFADLPQNPKIEQKFRDALESPNEVQETGDPVFDGMMDVIRSQGNSITSRLPPADFDLPRSPNAPQAWNPQIDENQYLLAEQLLMTARILNQGPRRDARQQLIKMLREEAVKCLEPSGP